MNRRDFLKSIGKVIGGLAIVPSVVKADCKEKPLECTCPAPYQATVRKEPVEHFPFCALFGEKAKPIWQDTEPLKPRTWDANFNRAYVIDSETNEIYPLNEQQRS